MKKYDDNIPLLKNRVETHAFIRNISKHRLPDGTLDVEGNLKLWNDGMQGFVKTPLWEKTPGWREDTHLQGEPYLVFVPGNPGSPTILIAHGGGFSWRTGCEGPNVAWYFHQAGYNTAILSYRLLPYDRYASMADMQRAIRLLRARKEEFGIGEKIVVMGFSAGGMICGNCATHFDNGSQTAPDLVQQMSSRPDASNEFHREVVRPKVTELLSPNPADYILDIACGNGNYSSYLAQRGASIVAFDYSKKMIELAKRRQSQYAKQIEFCVADATNRESILELKRNRAFTKAVSNMAIMDITDIEPLLMAVYELLEESGIFVFATQHPCFITLTEKYMTPHSYYGIAIEGQPEEQIYYHRSIQDIFNLCFRAGFVIDGFYEECFKTNKEIPMVMIVRLKKVKRDSLK